MDGQFFRTHDGPYTIIGCSDFLLFPKFARGEDIEDVVIERRNHGFNLLRSFLGIQGGLGNFDPRHHLDALPAFCRFIQDRGMRLELTFGDWKRWCPKYEDQKRLIHDVDERVPLVHLLEGMNEGLYLDNTAEGILEEKLQSGRLWSLGSRIQDAGTMEPVKTHGTYHPSRTSDWPRKVGHNCKEIADKYKKPMYSNECMRPDQDAFRISNFFDGAANGTLMCAGAVFHSTSGKTSTLFTDEEHRCAAAWVEGALAVPLKYQKGYYTAGHLHASPVVYRAGKWSHARILGNECCLSVPQNQNGWVEKNGWRIVKQNGSIIELVR